MLYDALIAAGEPTGSAILARKMAATLEGRVVCIDPDELHQMDVKVDSWSIAHPLGCRANLLGCEFNVLAQQLKGPLAPIPGRWTVMIEGEGKKRHLKVIERTGDVA